MPIVLMWIVFGAVSLDTLPTWEVLRAPAFYALVLPLLLTAMAAIKIALLAPPPLSMPLSGLAWRGSREPDHATFLARFASSRGRRPDVMIGGPPLMTELAVPIMSDGFVVAPNHRYWSSQPLEVWALVVPSQQQILLANFAGARRYKVATPPGYPFLFYIFDVEGVAPAAGTGKR